MSQIIPANNYINTFDFRLQFDLNEGLIKTDLSPSDIIDASGITVTFSIKRPDNVIVSGGTLIPENINAILTTVLPRIQNTFIWGIYTVTATLTIGNKTYTLIKTFNLCAPDSSNPFTTEITGNLVIQSDCEKGTITVSGFCGYAYKQQQPVTETYNMTRYYPPEAELLPQKNLAVLPFVADAYIGDNTVKGVNISTYDFGDNIFVILRAVASATKEVHCGFDLETIYCGMTNLLDKVMACQPSATDYINAFGEINALLWTVTAGLSAGKDVEPYIERLEELLGVECLCSACAGEKVGTTLTHQCPQVNNATASIDTSVPEDNRLKVGYTATAPISAVNIQYRPFCDPSVNTAWTDAGNFEIGENIIQAFSIEDPVNYQVKITSVLSDGSSCEPVILRAAGECPQVVDINVPPPIDSFVAQWGWSSLPITTDNVAGLAWVSDNRFESGSDIIADYSAAPENSFLAMRYPKLQPVKTTWYNTSVNSGIIPDQIFQAPYEDEVYRYIYTRIAPALQDSNKTIIYSD